MAMWASRASGYKVGVLVFFLGCAFYLMGYAAPFWLKDSTGYTGLWLACSDVSGFTQCFSTISSRQVGWFKVVQALESLALIGLFITGLYAIVVNCCQTAPSHNRVLEIMCGISGACGFIACMVYVGKTSEYLSDRYSWALGLNLTGCILVILTTIVIAVTNHADLATQTGGTVITYAGGVPPQGMNAVVVQQGQAYPAPAQGYPAQPGYVAQPGYYPGPAQYPAAAPPQAGYGAPGYSGEGKA